MILVIENLPIVLAGLQAALAAFPSSKMFVTSGEMPHKIGSIEVDSLVVMGPTVNPLEVAQFLEIAKDQIRGAAMLGISDQVLHGRFNFPIWVLSRSVTDSELRKVLRSMMDHMASVLLTQREEEVLDLVSKGLSNREIGAAIGVSERTVTNIVSRIYHKQGYHSRSEAVSHVNLQRLGSV